ncbi:hypothetical protein [Streptomyces sp. NBC_00582]|uniref:hypothetical protein n=1 Tax=Streptomyces sp. NBC_00582 TaxID=2975783 RepID=UPI00106304C8|nr:hypothetical protein [Streptomyces sp. NBC_00582]WUB63215.1 hypothetical protein OG852_23820 [Streptomyces sp. NBC_00582]
MVFATVLSVLLIVGAAAGVLAQRRSHRDRPPSDLDAEAEANHALVHLTSGLVPPDARAWSTARKEAGEALTRAAECQREARTRLTTARTATEYAEVTRLAREGLNHLRAARTDLGLHPTPAPPATFATTSH